MKCIQSLRSCLSSVLWGKYETQTGEIKLKNRATKTVCRNKDNKLGPSSV